VKPNRNNNESSFKAKKVL